MIDSIPGKVIFLIGIPGECYINGMHALGESKNREEDNEEKGHSRQGGE
jgi:hypothetical protein